MAFGALFAYPILLGVNARSPLAQRAGLHQGQIAFSKRVTGPAIGVILLAGVYMAIDAEVWDEGWVGASFALLLVIAGLGATVLRRGEEGLAASAETGDEAAYARALRTVRSWTLATLALVVLTIFVMTAKPF